MQLNFTSTNIFRCFIAMGIALSMGLLARGQQQINPSPFFRDMLEAGPQVEEEYRLRPGEKVREKITKNLLAKLEVNKTTCYEGEPIMATYKLCSRLRSESRITKRPSLNGFSVYDMVEPGKQNHNVEKVNGKNFNVHIIRRSQLFPLQAGTYTLDPIELENKVQFVKSGSSASSNSTNPMQRLLDRFFNQEEVGEAEEHSITLKSNRVTVTVRPLPLENKPAGFNGAVGKFTITASLKNKAIVAEDVAELEVVIKGSGNLPVINAPEINLPVGMEPFEPLIKEDIDKTTYPLSGSKTFTYSFLAHEAGEFIIPPVKFSYFNPASGSYKTISSDSFTIRVTEGRKKKRPADSIKADKANKSVANAPQANALSDKMMIVIGVVILLLTGIIALAMKYR